MWYFLPTFSRQTSEKLNARAQSSQRGALSRALQSRHSDPANHAPYATLDWASAATSIDPSPMTSGTAHLHSRSLGSPTKTDRPSCSPFLTRGLAFDQRRKIRGGLKSAPKKSLAAIQNRDFKGFLSRPEVPKISPRKAPARKRRACSAMRSRWGHDRLHSVEPAMGLQNSMEA